MSLTLLVISLFSRNFEAANTIIYTSVTSKGSLVVLKETTGYAAI